MSEELLSAIEASDSKKALEWFESSTKRGQKAWDVHLDLFPVVQRVLNPPFINPHLPKMYGVIRELVPYLEGNQIDALVSLEINEYTRRSKLEKYPHFKLAVKHISFVEIETAIETNDPEKALALMEVFCEKEGREELAKKLLLLGSGYLEQSIGHSVSCTAFILLEMLKRSGEDPLPSLWALANYFCKGHFAKMPQIKAANNTALEHALSRAVLKATSGRGFVNLHHTITLYSLARVAHLFTPEEFGHLLSACEAFIGTKDVEEIGFSKGEKAVSHEYPKFYEILSRGESVAVGRVLASLTGSTEDMHSLGQFLIRGVCDLYNGKYDPHFITGLGSALWVVSRFHGGPGIAASALYQYVDYFLGALKKES